MKQHYKTCAMCRVKKEFGSHKYYVKLNHKTGAFICQICRDANRGGVVLSNYLEFHRELKERGVDLTLNEKSFFDLY